MATKSQTQVAINLDRMNGRRMRALASHYRRQVIEPITDAVRGASSAEEALRLLSGHLLRRMGRTTLANAVAQSAVQAACIGRVTAKPGKRVTSSKLRVAKART